MFDAVICWVFTIFTQDSVFEIKAIHFNQKRYWIVVTFYGVVAGKLCEKTWIHRWWWCPNCTPSNYCAHKQVMIEWESLRNFVYIICVALYIDYHFE